MPVPGIGAGTKDFDKHPNILRVILGDVSAPPKAEEPLKLEELALPAAAPKEGDWTTRQLWILEANIDDMTGEVAGYLTEKVLEEGGLDAWVTPILMKKNRPAFTVHVLCEPRDQERFMRLLFVESTTLGVRRRSVDRCALRRKTVTASTAFGDVRVKVGDGLVCSGVQACKGVCEHELAPNAKEKFSAAGKRCVTQEPGFVSRLHF